MPAIGHDQHDYQAHERERTLYKAVTVTGCLDDGSEVTATADTVSFPWGAFACEWDEECDVDGVKMPFADLPESVQGELRERAERKANR